MYVSQKAKLQSQQADKPPEKACADCDKTNIESSGNESQLIYEESFAG